MARALLLDSRSAGLSARVDQDGFPILPPTLLTIHRTSLRDEQTRQIVCALDGKRFGQVLFGQRLTIEILPGPHALRIHNTLVWKTAEFAAKPGGTCTSRSVTAVGRGPTTSCSSSSDGRRWASGWRAGRRPTWGPPLMPDGGATNAR